MNYVELQNQIIIDFKINHQPISKCWGRTHCHPKERMVCKHSIKESYQSLFTLLHEIGHAETHKNSMKRCETESIATLWAIEQMRKLGLPIRRKVMKQYKAYIKMSYDRGIRRGLSKRIKTSLYM